MFQNLKSEILYFDTPTDFELEFNLCGCCRMRLLTDKTQDSKLFLRLLSRAVVRSQVILISGKLFGKNGIINLTSRAISKNTVIADNEAFGIASDDKIEIIEGSLPLVTPEGYFGGCVIESGPQALILLTDNKNVRKTIMQTLIHSYIAEISKIDESQETSQSEENNEIAEERDIEAEVAELTENAIINVITDDIADAAVSEILEDVEEDDFAPTEAEIRNDIDLSKKMFIEPSKVKFSKTSYYEDTYIPEAAESYVFEEPEFTAEPFARTANFTALILVLTVILLALVAVVCVFIFYTPYQNGSNSLAFLKEIYSTLFL